MDCTAPVLRVELGSLQLRRHSGDLDRRADTLQQRIFMGWLDQVTNDPRSDGASSNAVIRVGGDQDGRNGITSLPQVVIQLNSGHTRHIDIRYQAARMAEMRGCQEIGRGAERLDCNTAQRPWTGASWHENAGPNGPDTLDIGLVLSDLRPWPQKDALRIREGGCSLRQSVYSTDVGLFRTARNDD